MKLVYVIFASVLTACSSTNSGQVGVNSPNSYMEVSKIEDANGGGHWNVKIDTDADYEKCMRKFQGVKGAPGHCQEEADKALQKALETAGQVVDIPLGQETNPSPVQDGYAQMRIGYARAGWAPGVYLPGVPLPQAPVQQQDPNLRKDLELTAKALSVIAKRTEDNTKRIKKLEGGK